MSSDMPARRKSQREADARRREERLNLSHRQVANAIVMHVFRNTELEDYHAQGVPIDDARMKTLMIAACKRMAVLMHLMATEPETFTKFVVQTHLMYSYQWFADDVDLNADENVRFWRVGPVNPLGIDPANLPPPRKEHDTICEHVENGERVCSTPWTVERLGRRLCDEHDFTRGHVQ